VQVMRQVRRHSFSSRATRVFLVSGIRLYRDGLADLIARQEGFVVVGTAEADSEAIALVVELSVDVVIVDMAGDDPLSIVRSLTDVAPETKVLGLAVPENDSYVIASAEAGIDGFVRREASIGDLVAALAAAAHGEVLCSPKIAGSLLRRVTAVASDPRRIGEIDGLTPRELEVIDLIREGLSNKEIARRLSIALATVKNHVHSILKKLELRSRTQAVALVRDRAHR
jgi:two-component system, NarL family, nitrate/nitrite response regulator NarL